MAAVDTMQPCQRASLATMLVLTTDRQRGIWIRPAQYFRVGLLTTPPMLAVAALLLVAAGRS